MNIFLREWKRNRKSLLIWSIAISFLQFLQVSVYPSFSENLASTEQFLKALPEGLLKAFGMDQLNVGNILEYFGFKAYLLLTLFGGIYAILLASNMLVKEESEKTIEFLLAKPITRTGMITQKILLVFFNIFLFNLMITSVTYVSFEIYKTEDYSISIFFLLMTGAFLLHLTFASIGLAISAFLRKTKTVYPLAIGVIMGTYFLDVIAKITDQLEFLKYFSPFRYVDAPDIVLNGQIDSVYIGIMIIIMVFCLGFSYLYYQRKDITV
ncbi:ABC transporter permease subunit [Tepidibacillus marianensis]|uniref:ABC transporter permease subunit n=1 Tax=Tepidibacillus marianensis TaxID=3131995 RepID=UPI0030D165E3